MKNIFVFFLIDKYQVKPDLIRSDYPPYNCWGRIPQYKFRNPNTESNLSSSPYFTTSTYDSHLTFAAHAHVLTKRTRINSILPRVLGLAAGKEMHTHIQTRLMQQSYEWRLSQRVRYGINIEKGVLK